MNPPASPSFARLLLAEARGLAREPGAQAQVLWLPLLAGLFVAAIFAAGVARGLPIAVIDADGSAASRELVRHLQANAALRVAQVTADPAAAWADLRSGAVYGVLQIPAGFERDARRGGAAPVSLHVNTQYLLIGNMVQGEVMAVVMDFSARRAAGGLLAGGVAPAGLEGALQPLAARRSGLGNPHLNYLPFLAAAAIPCLLQIFMVLTGARLVGREFRIGAASTWLPVAARRPFAALAARTLPAAAAYGAVSLGFAAALFGWLGVPFRGGWALYAAGHAAFVAAALAMGALFAAVTANYRLACSVGALYAAPALAFSGVTFPLAAMPPLAHAWAHAIPATAFLRLHIEQAYRGAPAAASLPELAALAAFAVGGGLLAGLLIARRAGQPRYYGRL